MTSVKGIYTIIRQQYPALVPEVRLREFPALLLSEIAALHLKDAQRMVADKRIIEGILMGASEDIRRIVQIGYIEYLQNRIGNSELTEERVERALGSRALALWHKTKAERDQQAGKIVRARLVEKPRNYEKLPCDLVLIVDQQKEYYREIWRAGLPYYDQFLADWQVPGPILLSKQKGQCPACEMETVVGRTQNLSIGYTETTKYSDQNYNYHFRTYQCEKCELGWTEYRSKSTWSDTTYT